MKNIAKYIAGLFGLMTVFSGCQFLESQPEENLIIVPPAERVKVYFNCITPEEVSGTRKAYASIDFNSYNYDLLAKEGDGDFNPLNNGKLDYKAIYSGTEISPKEYTFQLKAYDGDNAVMIGTSDPINLAEGYRHVNFVMIPEPGFAGSARITVDFPDDPSVAKVETCITSLDDPFTPTLDHAQSIKTFGDSPEYNGFKRFILNYNDLSSGKDVFVYIRILDSAEKIISSRLEAVEVIGGAVAESKIYIEKLRTYAVSFPLKKDGVPGAFPGKEIVLKDKEGNEYVLTDDGNGNFTGFVADGEYDIIMRDKDNPETFKDIDTGLDFVVGSDKNKNEINFITVTLPGDAGLHYTPVEGGGIPVPVDSTGKHEKNDDGNYEYLVPSGGNLVVNVSYEEGFTGNGEGVKIDGVPVTPAESGTTDFQDENVLKLPVPASDTIEVSGVKAVTYAIHYLSGSYEFRTGYTAPASYTALTGAELPKYSDVKYLAEEGWVLDGWQDKNNLSKVYADIPKGMSGEITLTPVWKKGVDVTQPSDWVEEHPEIPGNFKVAPSVFACGYSLIIKWSDEAYGRGETNIYIDYNSNGIVDSNDLKVSGSYNPSTTDFTGYRLKAENADGTKPASNFTYTVQGGKLASMTGLGCDAQNTSTVNISGKNTVIGNGVDVGVDLPSLTNEWVNINDQMSGDYHITLETRHEFNRNEKTHKVAYIQNAAYAQTSKFTCIKQDTKKELGLGFSNITEKGIDKIIIYLKDPSPIHLPSVEEAQDGGLDVIEWYDAANTIPMEFRLGSTASINEKCSVFSISVKNGKFQLKDTAMKKENGDPLSTLNLGQAGPASYSETLKASTNYIYLHMFSQENMITPARATEFLRTIRFIKDSPNKEIEITLNLEAVPYEQIKAMQDKYTAERFNYFDGSFYLGIKLPSGSIKWHDAYNQAKQQVFNGMTGYLINITSEVENNYIFSRITQKKWQCWTGGARLDGRDVFDTEEVAPVPFVTLDTAFKWQSGPEAGTVYTDGTISTVSGTTAKSGFYSSCSYSTKDGNYYLNATKDVSSLAGKTVNYYSSSWKKLGSVQVVSYDPVKKQLKLAKAPASATSIVYVGDSTITTGTAQIQNSGRATYKATQKAEYTNWDGGEPNDSCSGKSEQCMHFLSSGKWNDYAADYGSVYGYIVEFTPYENQWNTEKANYPSMKAQMSY
ncbi:hypothetical protein [Treponema sp.]|uniref:hypothetical protein n=1 Tax=Treponema sp. TaxID=166 RepID=UPI00298E4BAC|nr:hypothetical protein [Treponema sp.]MCQ2241108.1 hypothetical protein [Treponema sp.]